MATSRTPASGAPGACRCCPALFLSLLEAHAKHEHLCCAIWNGASYSVTEQHCLCLQVAYVAEQHRTMIEAVENHMPETVIVVSTADLSCPPMTAFKAFCLTEHLVKCMQIADVSKL